ncbi:P-loop containing nucleoside triphosphate hydrolase protein [Tribonema minus]|uniref:Kinesin-like protein n=1 Tax=Tribonema minus TaxID=303371 RepID=A0A835YJB8_9STRA|nr:P-loop containing nucleoside triphosphate hydrolase protein [Tribonema minus]
MERARADRRQKTELARVLRAEEEKRNIANGNPGDIDFQRLIAEFRAARAGSDQPHAAGDLKICVALRKRPISAKEVARKDHDSVTVFNPKVTVHNCKTRVDGITKYLDSSDFQFDHAFGDVDTTARVYAATTRPLVPFVLDGGRATVFAYGQTGSGKTYTMVGIQRQCAEDLFRALTAAPPTRRGSAGGAAAAAATLEVYVSFFEIYGGRCQDLLNRRHRLDVREDGQGDVHIAGLEEFQAASAEELEQLIDRGNRNRTTHATESNDTSSRSHAICQIALKEAGGGGRLHGKLSLIDLAGSERGADTKSHNRQRRMEGAEINKSLLALKECIRALDSGEAHVPYRASKLTLVLKDSFTRRAARTVMIATVSPGASHADHTLNTLRYADRVKETKVADFADARRQRQRRSSGSGGGGGEGKSAGDGGADSGAGDDIRYLHETLRLHSTADSEEVVELHRTVQSLFEKEEALLNMHMSVIQENAELLTEEGRLLQQIQGDDVVDYDIDAYAARLSEILDRKMQLTAMLKLHLGQFRRHLEEEESVSKRVSSMPQY